MGANASTEQSGVEPGFDIVPANDPSWAEIAELFNTRSEGYKTMYGYELRMKKLWRVRPCKALANNESQAQRLGSATKLFHGTSMAKATSIAKSGFKLPERRGMFGRGVYFANTPLKSATFAPENSWWPALDRVRKDGIFRALTQKGQGQMLLCDVYLGSPMTLRRSNNRFNPAEDLQAGWLRKSFGLGDYDSVHAPGGLFGAVNVEEYVVYKEQQGVPQFLIEFDYVHLR